MAVALIVLGVATGSVAASGDKAQAANTREYGTDTSVYQGYTVVKGRPDDKFNVAQVGGYTNGYYYDQATYKSQVSSGIAQGLYEGTYIWFESGTSSAKAVEIVNHFLPKIQTPKHSVIALDVEAGYSSAYKQANTNAIKAGLRRIKQAGYTPVLYTGKSYITNVAYPAQIVKEFGKVLWLAQYPTMQVTQTPNMNYAPVIDGYNSWQYSSMGRAQGLDMNVSFTNIWHSGYDGKYKPGTGGKVPNPVGNNKKQPQAIKDGLNANKTPKSAIKVGDYVKVNFKANRWSNGAGIPSWVKGKSYKVIQISGNKLLLGGIMSWINKKDAEILIKSNQASHPSKQTSTTYYTVRSGDFASTIATRYGITTGQLKSWNNIPNINLIYPGQRLIVKKGVMVSKPVTTRYYTVKYGDMLSVIANRLGVSQASLISRNGIPNANRIYVGQRLAY